MTDYVVRDLGSGVVTVTLDHELRDAKGRAIGGRAQIEPSPYGPSLRIHSTRDGVAFGALRRRTYYISQDKALEAARRKLAEQGRAFRRRYGSREL